MVAWQPLREKPAISAISGMKSVNPPHYDGHFQGAVAHFATSFVTNVFFFRLVCSPNVLSQCRKNTLVVLRVIASRQG